MKIPFSLLKSIQAMAQNVKASDEIILHTMG